MDGGRKTLVQRAAAVGLAVLACAPAARAAEVSSVPLTFPGVPGDVRALATDGERLFVGGDIGTFARTAGPVTLVDPADGTVIAGSEVLGAARNPVEVTDVIADGDGGFYVSGTFATVAGVPAPGLARLRADGTADPAFRPDLSGRVLDVHLTDGRLWVTGDIVSAATPRTASLVALDPDSGALLPVQPPVVSGTVDEILVRGTRAYLRGRMNSVGGLARDDLASFDTETGAVSSLQPSFAGDLADFAVVGSAIVVVGGFYRVGIVGTETSIVDRDGGAAFDATTGALLPFAPSVDSYPEMVATDDAIVILSDSKLRTYAPDTTTTTVLPILAEPANQFVDAISEGPGRTLVASGSPLPGGRFGVARYTLPDGRPTSGWESRYGGLVGDGPDALGLVRGSPLAPSTVTGRKLAALDLRTETAIRMPEFGVFFAFPRPSERVDALAVARGRVWAGGTFTEVDGAPRKHVAAVDVATGAVVPGIPEPNGPVTAAAADGEVVWVGGDFTAVGSVPRAGLAAFSAVDGSLLPTTASAPCLPRRMLIADGTLLVGGCSTIGGAGDGLLNLDAATGEPTSRYAVPVSGEVSSMAPSPRGGVWISASPRTARYLPGGGQADSVPDAFQSLAEVGGALLLPTGDPAEIRLADRRPGTWFPIADGGVVALALPDDRLVVATDGPLTGLGGSRSGIAVYGPEDPFPPEGGPVTLTGGTVVEQYRSATQLALGAGTGTPARVGYRWQRCAADGTGCVETEAYGGPTTELEASAVGRRVRVLVTRSGDGGTTETVTSPLSPVITGFRGDDIAALTPPTVTGSPIVGSTLNATRGTWSAPVSGVYLEWQRCDVLLHGCVDVGYSGSYTVQPADRGRRLRVRFDADGGDGRRVDTTYSSGTAVVDSGVPSAYRAPRVAGDPAVGSTLRTTAGSFSDHPTRVTVRWLRCDATGEACSPTGADGRTYAVTAADDGRTLRSETVATNAVGSSAANRSQPFGIGVSAPPAPTPTATPGPAATPGPSPTAGPAPTPTPTVAPAPRPTATPAPPVAPLRVRLAPRRTRLATALKRGIPVGVTCTRRCRVSVTVTITASTARALRLPKRTIASLVATTAARRTLTLKLGSAVRRRLAKRRTLPVTVTARATAGATTTTSRAKLTLGR
jgi:hypothetical protein